MSLFIVALNSLASEMFSFIKACKISIFHISLLWLCIFPIDVHTRLIQLVVHDLVSINREILRIPDRGKKEEKLLCMNVASINQIKWVKMPYSCTWSRHVLIWRRLEVVVQVIVDSFLPGYNHSKKKNN